MTKEVLDEREFELINIIGANLAATQRDLSRHMDLSLGQTNMLLRRLIAKGYIRITQLNKRKVQYLLTPKGFSEKMQKSIKYTLKTINSIGLIKERIKEVLIRLYEEGEREFIVVGKSDFALLIEIVLKEITATDYKIKYLDSPPAEPGGGTLLICRENVDLSVFTSAQRSIDLIHELAKDHAIINDFEQDGELDAVSP
ncbi:MAG: hypothetical protein A2Z88_10660 [Omnitrophica WOR_2 bacterium GWA2_47_8]|nr:MAG: hypothetical protein A2Z88_10660 [Omnitrophica WOR_2 bacterium GWA2_47_8]